MLAALHEACVCSPRRKQKWSHHKKGKNQKPGKTLENFLHASSLLIEAIFLKAKSFQNLGALEDAAHERTTVLDLMEEALPEGMPSTWGDTKVAMLVNKVLILYSQLLAQEGLNNRAVPAYRQALLGIPVSTHSQPS